MCWEPGSRGGGDTPGPGSNGLMPVAGSALPRPACQRLGAVLAQSCPHLTHLPQPLSTFFLLCLPLFKDPVPSCFWTPHVPVSGGQLRSKTFSSHIRPCVPVLQLSQGLQARRVVADTVSHTGDQGGLAQRVKKQERIKSNSWKTRFHP